MTAYSGFVVPERDARRHAPAGLDWLSDGVVIAQRLGTTETTAIVHPRKFTAAMMSAAQQHGAELRRGRVTGLVRTCGWIDRDGRRGRRRRHRGGCGRGRAGALVAARRRLDGLPAVFGRRSPSLVYDTGTDVPADALFLEYQDESGAAVTVEVFPRADGSTHVTAFSDEAPLPLDPAAVTPEPGEIDRLQAICERLSPAVPRRERSSRGRPASARSPQDGLPLIGKVPDRGRLCGDRPQCLGHPQRAGDRRSAGGADRRRRRAQHRPDALRPGPAPPLDPSLLRSR